MPAPWKENGLLVDPAAAAKLLFGCWVAVPPNEKAAATGGFGWSCGFPPKLKAPELELLAAVPNGDVTCDADVPLDPPNTLAEPAGAAWLVIPAPPKADAAAPNVVLDGAEPNAGKAVEPNAELAVVVDVGAPPNVGAALAFPNIESEPLGLMPNENPTLGLSPPSFLALESVPNENAGLAGSAAGLPKLNSEPVVAGRAVVLLGWACVVEPAPN